MKGKLGQVWNTGDGSLWRSWTGVGVRLCVFWLRMREMTGRDDWPKKGESIQEDEMVNQWTERGDVSSVFQFQPTLSSLSLCSPSFITWHLFLWRLNCLFYLFLSDDRWRGPYIFPFCHYPTYLHSGLLALGARLTGGFLVPAVCSWLSLFLSLSLADGSSVLFGWR